jgi:hypothetical protein
METLCPAPGTELSFHSPSSITLMQQSAPQSQEREQGDLRRQQSAGLQVRRGKASRGCKGDKGQYLPVELSPLPGADAQSEYHKEAALQQKTAG